MPNNHASAVSCGGFPVALAEKPAAAEFDRTVQRAKPFAEHSVTVCALCGAELRSPILRMKDRLHHTPGIFGRIYCAACQHYQTTGVTDELLADAYPPYYVARALGRQDSGSWRERTLNHFVARIDAQRAALLRRRLPITSDWRVLDAGCGNGNFLAELCRQTSCRGMGLDMDARSVEQVKQRPGLDAIQGTLERDLPDGVRFHLLTLWHVLEHLADPVEVLRAARRCVRSGGHLVVAVPDAQGLAARFFGNFWFGCDIPRHLQHFTPDSLRAALLRAGWEPLSFEHVTEVSTIAGSLHNLLGRRWCDDLSGHLLRWCALQGLCLPLDHLLRLLGGGDWMIAIARRMD